MSGENRRQLNGCKFVCFKAEHRSVAILMQFWKQRRSTIERVEAAQLRKRDELAFRCSAAKQLLSW